MQTRENEEKKKKKKKKEPRFTLGKERKEKTRIRAVLLLASRTLTTLGIVSFYDNPNVTLIFSFRVVVFVFPLVRVR